MKKVLFAVMAVVAISLAACTSKPAQPAEAAEDEVVATINADDEAAATINELQAQIDAKDANKFQEVLSGIQEKIKQILTSDPEAAKAYVAKVQDFLKENAEKIKECVGDNETINSAISALTEAPADAIVSGLSSAVESIGNAAEGVANAAAEKAEDAKNSIADKANELKDKALGN